jgi:hypothetical protein
MSKTTWKLLSWLLATLLTTSIALFGIPFSYQSLLAQSGKTFSGSPTDWGRESIKSMIERYDFDSKFVSEKGLDHPDVRADIAEWIAVGLQANEKKLEDDMKVISQEIEILERLYNEALKEYDAYPLW